MKQHTAQFKQELANMGRQLRAIITYGNVMLEEQIYSITPHYQADILKSVMKQLDLELSVNISLGTVINCQIGIFVNNNYEMLDFGNYVVYKSEKQEDTNTYKLTCYDKMLYSMKQNEELNITYPISLKNYLNAIANKIGLSVATTTFYNESRMINQELYFGLEYTYRDILDEIAQATGSIICLNNNDEIVLKYPTQTNDTIDENYFKDINVEFGQMYGAINTIVLSRSGDSDNIYYPATLPENPIEIKISDNQIMNWNDRSDYLEGIYNALNGLYYYINDFSSTGILYYEVGDLYNVSIGENTYQCLMLNDEININSGIEETIYTELSEKSETDYTKADKTDRKINQTNLVVDKQNQTIEGVITTQTEQSQQISRVIQTVDELNSKISDIADITTSLESNSATVSFEDVNQSEPIRIVVHPIVTNISKLYPSQSLKPNTNLTIKTRLLRLVNTSTNEVWEYELPEDLLYYDSENYDEFILDYDAQTCLVNKRCKWNNDGTVGLLANEETHNYTYPRIELTDGDYTISLIQYNVGYLFVRLMAQNIYTTQFATKAELNSEINQTKDEIDLSVNQRLSNYSTTSEMNSAINLKANEITSSVSNTYATKGELSSTSTSLNSKIDQKADEITSTVSATYSTKTETNTAKQEAITSSNNATDNKLTNYSTKNETSTAKSEAISSANSSTDTKLLNYSTTTQMNTAINQKADQITLAVSQQYSKKADTIASVDVEYALSTSTSTAPITGWSTIAPTWEQGKYMWQRTTTYYVDGSSEVSNPTCIAGAKGQDGTNGIDGTDGEDGIGVSEIVEQYYLSTSNSTQTGGSWQTTQPTWENGKYIWIRSKITWTDSTITYTTPILADSVNKANETAYNTNQNLITNYYTKSEINVQNDRIEGRIDAIEDLTNEATGIKSVTLQNCVVGSLLEMHIFGNNSVFDALYPLNNLYPTNNLYPYGDSRIVVTDENNNSKTYELGITDVLRQNGDVQDEYVLEYGQAKVIRRINSDGTIKQTETIEELGDFAIDIANGTNTITIKNYSASLNVKYAIKGDFTEVFATKVEMNSSITQTAEEINLEVSKKVDESEFATKITQNYESVQLAWNNISRYIQFINAQLRIMDSNNALLMALTQYGQNLYNNNSLVGTIGTGMYTHDYSQKSLIFSLGTNGKYMGWFKKNDESSVSYAILYYARANSFGRTYEGIYMLKPLFFNSELRINYGIMTLTEGGEVYEITFGDSQNDSFFRSNRVETNITGHLYVNGNEVVTNTSDARLKHNIYDSNISALDRILQIKHRQFVWNDSNKEELIGYIAQELEDIDENYVIKNPQKNENGDIIDYIYQVNLLPILATTTKSIQELKAEVDNIKEKQEKQQQFLEMLASKFEMQDEYNDIFFKKNDVKAIKRNIKLDNVNELYNIPIKSNKNFKKDTQRTILAMKDNGETFEIKENLRKEINNE